ncbi:unnamed protein product, partial [Brachionus calyciflorus]
ICNKFRPSDSSTTTGGEQPLGPAILDENYIISFIDPNKYCKCIEYNSPSNEVKFVQMIYCYATCR